MTFPRRRQHPRDPRAPAFTDDRDITEVLGRPADWDGTTYAWGGASDVGLPGGDAYPPAPPAAAPFDRLRAQPHGPDMFPALSAAPSAYQKCLRCQANNHCRGATVNCDCTCTGADPPYAAPDAAPVGYEVTGRETGRGWPHLFELRCDYPAALAATPIPCDSAWRDHTATSFRALRQSAQATGWHMDRLGQWACPRCCQASTEYRGLYPVTVWDMLAAEAYVTGDLHGENRERARAELALRDRTLHHHDASHRRGRHADELEVAR